MQTIILFKASSSEDDTFETILKEEGFQVISIKILEFQYENLDELQKRLRTPDAFSGVLFSSPRCVSACLEALQGAALPPGWTDKQNYAIGPSTVGVAERLLHLTCNGSEAGNAGELVHMIRASKHSELTHLPLLYPRSNLAKDTIRNLLGADALCDVIAYKTTANPNLHVELMQKLENFHILADFAVYFSPSGVEAMNMFHTKINHLQLKVIAIGPTTAQALEKHNIHISGVCDKPIVSSLLALVKKLMKD